MGFQASLADSGPGRRRLDHLEVHIGIRKIRQSNGSPVLFWPYEPVPGIRVLRLLVRFRGRVSLEHVVGSELRRYP